MRFAAHSSVHVKSTCQSRLQPDVVCRDMLMEEVNALHERFENPRTRRTYRSGGKGFDVSSLMY